ncbi:MAG: hypothetical protein V2I36_13335 [Desulfopila sp.]|jgi:hypothetical protein|nr:hypothetical protein [Desulfopila sp.]
MALLRYEYIFTFRNGKKKNFTIEIDHNTLLLVQRKPQWADWSKLSYRQCPNCPLSLDQNTYCPIAANLSELVKEFTDTASYESCHVSCVTAERTISKDTIVQEGLSSIMGLIMATSGCPVMHILKPMARFHLPFATIDEAMFRSVSVYLLRQFFIHLNTKTGDFQLEKVRTYYKQIEEVNRGMLSRIKEAGKLDADRNAIVILNCLAQILYLELDDNLQSLQYLFSTS